MNCPKCQSNDWKFASVVYKQGQTLVNESSSGSAIGVGVATGGIGAAYAKNSNITTGEHTTPFAQSSAPPDVPPHPGIKEDRATHEARTSLMQYIFGALGLFLGFKINVWLGIFAVLLLCSPFLKKTWISEREDGY
jgi:hypothetical protein